MSFESIDQIALPSYELVETSAEEKEDVKYAFDSVVFDVRRAHPEGSDPEQRSVFSTMPQHEYRQQLPDGSHMWVSTWAGYVGVRFSARLQVYALNPGARQWRRLHYSHMSQGSLIKVNNDLSSTATGVRRPEVAWLRDKLLK